VGQRQGDQVKYMESDEVRQGLDDEVGSRKMIQLGRGRWLVSRRLLNPYREIGSRYPSMSMIVIGLSLPILRQRWCCLLFDVN
jgi:hypothetical protein